MAEPSALPARPSRLTRAPKSIFSGLSVAVLAVAALILAASLAPRLLGYGTLAVTSGSMGSTTPIGSLVIARWTPAAEIRTGDVIVAQREEGGRKQAKVLHRVISLEHEGSVEYVRTKGDANPEPDPGRYALPPRVLTQAHTIPYLGYLIGAIHIPLVWALVVGLPAVILAALFLRDIWRSEEGDAPRREDAVEVVDEDRADFDEQAAALAAEEAALAEREQRLVQAEARNEQRTEELRIQLLQLEQVRAQAAQAASPAEDARPVKTLPDPREREAKLAALERELDRRVAAMQTPAEPEPPATSLPSPVHLVLVPAAAGYALVERAGAPPAPGAELAIAASEQRRFIVVKVARSPLPGDGRPCAYLLPA